MDIIVTTPKKLLEQAAQEAEDAKREGGGSYFRNLGAKRPKNLNVGDRCFYVEDGAVRGYCVVSDISEETDMMCSTSAREFGPGFYVFMEATSWCWLAPIPFRGFQGWRYSRLSEREIVVLGSWLEPRPD